MDLTLPPLDLPSATDSRFDAVRRHASAATLGGHLLVGANIALGAALAIARQQIQPTPGRKLLAGTGMTWGELVTQQTPYSSEYARRAEKVATDLLHRLSGQRTREALAVKAILKDPHANLTPDDYATLARAAGTAYDADTWSGILAEIGILKRPPRPGIGTKDTPAKLPLTEEARIFATGFLKSIRIVFAHPEQVRRRLAALPIAPTGDPERPSLLELEAELKTRLEDIQKVIGEKGGK